MFSKTVIFACLLIVALFGLSTNAENISGKPFNFQEFYQGNWDIHSSLATAGKTIEEFDLMVLTHVTITPENTTNALTGHSFVNNTANADVSNFEVLRVEFAADSVSTGSFKSGSSEEALKEVFAFNFTEINNSLAISRGAHKAGSYQFIVTAKDSFVLIISNNKSTETFYGKKIPTETEKTFFQKYGTFVMIAVMMLFNMYVQNKTKQAAFPEAAPAATPAVAAAPASKKKN